jgi:hypothetical protein
VKKNSRVNRKRSGKEGKPAQLTVGIDLGDRSSRYCIVEMGEALVEGSLASTRKGLDQVFGELARCRVAIEVGTHSLWVSRQLVRLGDRGQSAKRAADQ